MTKKEFLKNYEEILKTRKGIKKEQGILCSQKDREKCDFTGVYAIFNNDELVYIGSGYTPQKHNIKKRLAQYVSKEDTGNTLLKKVINNGLALNNAEAIKLIEQFEFIAFEHHDLENELIHETQLPWNKKGNRT